MRDNTRPAFHALHETQDSGQFTLDAYQGKQAIGRVSQEPIDVTEYGQFVLTVRGSDDTAATLLIDNPDDADALVALIQRASSVAHSRDRAEDVARKVNA